MGERVAPSDLEDHRHTHDFRGPCCLCAVFDASGSVYTESVMFVAISGEFAGEYVAACAADSCNYLSKYYSLVLFNLLMTALWLT